MGTFTPPMDKKQKKEYLESHLKNELEWVLRAAAMWHVQNEIKLGCPGYEVQVFAMDSSCLHARALFEFFTQGTTRNHYGCEEYLGKGNAISSLRYPGDWEGPLHSHLMHAQDRSKSQKLTSFDGHSQKDLNEMPVDFAIEIVRMWREFEKSLGSHNDPDINALQRVAENILKDAISNAKPIYSSKKIEQPDVKPIIE